MSQSLNQLNQNLQQFLGLGRVYEGDFLVFHNGFWINSGVTFSYSGGTGGTSGTSGRNGLSGTSGTSGTGGSGSGSSGSSGINGSIGSSGTNGTSGMDGIDGFLPGIGNNNEILFRYSTSIYGYNTSTGLTYDGTTLTTNYILASGLTLTGISYINYSIPSNLGSSGTNGTSGSSGSLGSPGSSGTNGTSGSSGTNGTSGSSGSSGTNGTSGSSGTNGTSGSSGSSGSNANQIQSDWTQGSTSSLDYIKNKPTNLVVNDGVTPKVTTIVVMTQADYTTLGSKDASTLYVIVG